jgi:hypothetical protein
LVSDLIALGSLIVAVAAFLYGWTASRRSRRTEVRLAAIEVDRYHLQRKPDVSIEWASKGRTIIVTNRGPIPLDELSFVVLDPAIITQIEATPVPGFVAGTAGLFGSFVIGEAKEFAVELGNAYGEARLHIGARRDQEEWPWIATLTRRRPPSVRGASRIR